MRPHVLRCRMLQGEMPRADLQGEGFAGFCQQRPVGTDAHRGAPADSMNAKEIELLTAMRELQLTQAAYLKARDRAEAALEAIEAAETPQDAPQGHNGGAGG